MLRVRTAITGWGGGPGLTTMYFSCGTEDAAAALRCAGYVHSLLDSHVSGGMPTSVDLQVSGDVDLLTAATGAITDTFSVTPPAVINGSGGTDFAPPAAAALARLSTGNFVAGRRVKGRIFVSPICADKVASDGTLDSGFQGALAGLLADFVGVKTSGDDWVVWHRPKGGSGGLACPITATSGASKIAVLTSRRD